MYLNHEDLSKYWVIDIEADSLKPTTIWCAVAINAGTKEVQRLVGHQAIRAFIEANRQAIWVGHNAISYDIPNINRLIGTSIPVSRIVDTLVLSYLYDPVMPGGHSLGAWGERFKLPKGDFSDFSVYSSEMLVYCEQDVRITLRLFLSLTKRMAERGFSERSCEIEHRTRHIIDKQQRTGWFFDLESASALYERLTGLAGEHEVSIRELFPPILKEQGTYAYRTKQDGTPFASYARHLERYPEIRFDGLDSYTVYDWEEFNLASPLQRVERLQSLGWTPTKFTKKGNPQVDEESLVEYANASGIAEVQALADVLVLRGRSSMLKGWIDNTDPTDSRIHGTVFSCGAASRRMTHASPNTANVPSNEARYGEDCRRLWTVHDKRNRRIVGHDAKAAQMRMFGHYLGDPDTARLYIEGDPHQVNADNVGIPRRPMKNVFYAFIFGAWDPKLGTTAGTERSIHPEFTDKAFGEYIRTTLYRTTPGLEDLIKSIEYEWSTNDGWITCIDGGLVRCPKKSAALNYKVQSAEACLMKQASIFIEERIKQRGLDAQKIADIHDEGQHETSVQDAEETGRIKVQAIRDAGEELGFSVPQDGDYKVGLSWAETH